MQRTFRTRSEWNTPFARLRRHPILFRPGLAASAAVAGLEPELVEVSGAKVLAAIRSLLAALPLWWWWEKKKPGVADEGKA